VCSSDLIERVARICVEHFWVDGIRLTGGEPTMRAHLTGLIEKLTAIRVPSDARSDYAGKAPDIALTTNGATLRNIAGDLRRAGLHRINISLDSLRQKRFLEMTRRDELDNVLQGIAAAKEAGFHPVKINTVIERGVNDDEIIDLAAFGRDNDLEVRFIEYMPLDASNEWLRSKVVSQDEIVALIHEVYPLEQVPARGAAPADRWRYLDGKGIVGVIPSVTKPFCGDCDRVRITADGQFRTCLFATDETDLRVLLRDGSPDDVIAAAIKRSVGNKWAGHQIGQVQFVKPRRSMSQIGG
jgi:cyclic pyranopterin phosphate synthase